MRPVPKSDVRETIETRPDDHGLPRTAVASGTVVGSGTMAAWADNDTMDFYLPALGGGMPTFGPREWLSDETVREILEALGIESDPGDLTMHDMIEVTALGENSAGITQEQYAVLTNDPGAFFDWFERHHGDECVHATAAPHIRLRPSACRLDAITVVTDPVDYDPRFMALALPSKTRIKQWNSLCHAMMRRHEIERELQENFEDLAPLKMKFDEGIIPWIRERGGRFNGFPSRSRHLHNDFFARALTYMDGEFLIDLLPQVIDFLGGYTTLSGCPLVLIALEHGHCTVARSLLEHGADGSVTGSMHGIFTNLRNPAFDQFGSWLTGELAVLDNFLSAVLLLPHLRGHPGVTEHIAKFAGVKGGPLMRRIREAEARFGFTMATRSARTLILDQVAGEYNINRRDGCDTPSRVWGGLTATPENVHYVARERFNDLWKSFLEGRSHGAVRVV